MSDEHANYEEAGNPHEHGNPQEHRNKGAGDKRVSAESVPFLTLRDHVRLATPVHPPSDPAADQRRRSRSLRQLLSLFTGQDYGLDEDVPGGPEPTAAAGAGERGGDEMLGGPRDDDAASTGSAGSSAGSASSDAPLHWDRPLAALAGDNFSMPSVLPTALKSDSILLKQPWSAGASETSSPSPADGNIETGQAQGSADSAGIEQSFSSGDLPTAPGSYSAAGASDSGAVPAPATAAGAAGEYPSALKDDALAKQLSGPVSALPTALPADQPDSPAGGTDSRQLGESTGDAEPALDRGSASAADDEGGSAASAGITASQQSPGLGAGSPSRGQASSNSGGGVSISVSIPDLSGMLAKVAQSGMPTSQAADGEAAATIASSLATAMAQLKDLNSRFEEHRMNEFMKSAQMRAIYG